MLCNRTLTLSCALALTSAAWAQTWVSATSGNDSNACTRTAPCKTFQRAVNVTPAWSEVHVMDAGEYGPVTISQAVTIDGGNLGTILATTGDALVVNAGSGAVVQIRNLAIHGDGATMGVEFVSGAQLLLENVKVNGFGGSCVIAEVGGSADLVIKDSSIDNCSNAGINLQNSTNLSVEISNTQVHFANTGLYAYAGKVTVSGSSFSGPMYGSNSWGVYTPTNGIATVMLDNCVLSNYAYAVYAVTGTIQANRSTFANNTTALIYSPGVQLISNGNNSFSNNGTNGSFTSTVSLQ